MNDSKDPQERAFHFLLEKYNSQDVFTKGEFQAATGWSNVSFETYLSKQFKPLLITVGAKFRVHGVFGRYTDWNKFRENVVTQNRKLQKPYTTSRYENVMVFDFFMPLRNEEYLRTALDSLFFKDSVLFRLKALDESGMAGYFQKKPGEIRDDYFARICEWISDKFVGYSVHHVDGRFRVGELKTRDAVYDKATKSFHRYLVDETTAVVRFIIPCTPSIATETCESGQQAGLLLTEKTRTETEENRIRWFFTNLFVERICEVVGGEDEIWLLESGMRNQLHIWRTDSQ
jgi:hypothetical protein